MPLDIASYARRGPARPLACRRKSWSSSPTRPGGRPRSWSRVSGGATSLQAALAHLKYIDRRGRIEIETDQGEVVHGNDAEKSLIYGLGADLVAAESRSPYRGKVPGRKAAKLVHNIVLSMPAGTPPGKLMAASREFAREEFALTHRYAMVLHTDQDHPHVHLVVKAVSEEGGKRLNIRKATLRGWRRQFAAHLRAAGDRRQCYRPRRSRTGARTRAGRHLPCRAPWRIHAPPGAPRADRAGGSQRPGCT